MRSRHFRFANSLRVEVQSWQAWPSYADAWAALVESSPEATFFVSREWVACWLDSFGASLTPNVLVVRDGERPVAMCLLVRRTVRRGPFAIRRIYLNTSGEEDRDSACTEFDTLVCEPGRETAVALAIRDYLLDLRVDEPWDELVFSGAVETTALAALQNAFGKLHVTDQQKPSFYVDLEDVRATGKDYLNSLSSRLRTQFRQSERRYAETGPLVFEEAKTVDQAQTMLTELAELHQASWTQRGAPGSFASPVFFRFHRDLIARSFDRGHIQMLRLRAGDTTIGALYNHVFRGKVYFYQCGFNYALDKRLSPGLITQVYAIRHAAEAGLAEYDLMAGDVDYKRKLAPKHRDLHWLTWRAPGVKMKAFDLLRDTKHWVERTSSVGARSLMASFRSRLSARS